MFNHDYLQPGVFMIVCMYVYVFVWVCFELASWKFVNNYLRNLQPAFSWLLYFFNWIKAKCNIPNMARQGNLLLSRRFTSI